MDVNAPQPPENAKRLSAVLRAAIILLLLGAVALFVFLQR